MKAPSLKELRAEYKPRLPKIFQQLDQLSLSYDQAHDESELSEAKENFPEFSQQKPLSFISEDASNLGFDFSRALRVGVVLSGGQAAGGHNVILGLLSALEELNPSCRLFGFLNGPGGICKGESIEITSEYMKEYLNQGGFDMIGSGRTKIVTQKQMQEALDSVKQLGLDALVIIGGDDSNTNAMFLAHYFEQQKQATKVFGIPKTIDGDLRGEGIEMSFGFDTACKTYSEMIGNIMKDVLSAKKYYHFIRLMGRNASHITLECALQTAPNLALLSEEIYAKKLTLKDVVNQLVLLVERRASIGKNYGVVLIPEGIIEFIPEVKALVEELNDLMGLQEETLQNLTVDEKSELLLSKLSSESKACFSSLPKEIQKQLLLDRDPHGNVQVSKIETEKLLAEMVEQALMARKHVTKFGYQTHFFGYEGRSAYPSNFDCQYCFSLGYTAALLCYSSLTAYIVAIQGLSNDVEDWKPGAVPLISMMHKERRKGKIEFVINKALVDLKGPVFGHFKENRLSWEYDDAYTQPGPIQFFGPQSITDASNFTLALESTLKSFSL
ncbi:MAG: diphosphate--fructose-6-phosphate 1-phosphotransferase [Chlamydiales bacterium]|nr:diphosphate--fructose-6-phosphate 1-phosphotransferase [Chlamydiales bacterium]